MKKYILLAAIAVSLTACNSEDNYIEESSVAAQISATIGERAVSRASDASWDNGDVIGISMGDRYLNMKYTTGNGDGIFTGNTMYFKNKQEPVMLTAYYPYIGSEGQTPAIVETSTPAERQTPAEQSKFDFLHAKLTDITGQNPHVDFKFSHEMSKLTLIFKNGNDGTDVGLITSYTIEGLVLDGTFNTESGECLAKADVAAKPLTMTPTSVEDGKALPSLILFPQAVDKVTLKIKDSEDQAYSCDLYFGNNGMMSGNNYQFTITVKKTSLSVNANITDWISNDLKSEATSTD